MQKQEPPLPCPFCKRPPVLNTNRQWGGAQITFSATYSCKCGSKEVQIKKSAVRDSLHHAIAAALRTWNTRNGRYIPPVATSVK